MAFYNNYQGDESSLKIIIDNIEKKSILLPGISCRAGIEVSELGDICYYFKRSGSSLSYDKAGKPINFDAVGVSRKEFPMEYAIQIGDVVPVVRTNSTVNVVEDRLAYQAIEAANMQNKLALKYMMLHGTDIQDYTDLTEENAYDKLVELIEDFKLNNKSKGLEVQAIFTSNAAARLLLSDVRFTRFATSAGDFGMYNNIIGKIGNAFVFEAPDMDDDQDFDYIALHSEAFVAPLNISSLRVTPGAQYGYPSGSIIAGELRVGFDVADSIAILCKKNKLSLKAPAVKFSSNYETAEWAAVKGATGYLVDDNGAVASEPSTDLSVALTYTTTEKYIAVKSVTTSEDYESTGSPFSEKLFYEQRVAPVLSIEEDVISWTDADDIFGRDYVLTIKNGTSLFEYNVFGNEYGLSDLDLEPSTYTCTVRAKGSYDPLVKKNWKDSEESNSVTYAVEAIGEGDEDL